VTVKGEPCNDPHNGKNGMVMDFSDLKSIVKSIIDPLDHAVLLNGRSEHKKLGENLLKEGHKVIFTDYQPTCENMLYDFADKIQSKLPEEIILAKLKLYETETSYGEWIREDQ
jgi:6-pyruvoyltetrahydropterin/6-carboxytetrahydropterin synthase